MSWVRIDDQFPMHPKIVTAGPLAEVLQERAACYASRQLTDGFIPFAVLPLLLVGFERLFFDGKPALDYDWPGLMMSIRVPGCDVGLWEKTDGGWLVHDYLDYNPSRYDIEQLRKTKSRAGRSGGLAKGKARAKARANAKVKANAKQTDSTCQPVCQDSATTFATEVPVANRHTPAPTPAPTPSTKNPPYPPAVADAFGETSTPTSSPRGTALKDVLTHTEAVRANLLGEGFAQLPPKERGFDFWACLQRMVSGDLPVETALRILEDLKGRWAGIRCPWAYVQTVLDKEHAALRIRIQLESHERLKRSPANLVTIGEVFRQVSEGRTPDAAVS